VVGDNDDTSSSWDVGSVTVTDAVTEIEVIQHLIDKVKTAEILVLLKESIDFLLVGDFA
jgi:hypothetical protein